MWKSLMSNELITSRTLFHVVIKCLQNLSIATDGDVMRHIHRCFYHYYF
jgi:hypothetical protein